MNLKDKLKKGALVVTGLAVATSLTYLGYNALKKYEDSRAKLEALETCTALVEEMKEKTHNKLVDIFVANLRNKGIDYSILVEIREKRLTIERKLGPDSAIVYVDDEVDGKLDKAYIIRTPNSKNLEIYSSKTPDEFEGMFRRELKSIHKLLKEYKEIKVKPASPKGQPA